MTSSSRRSLTGVEWSDWKRPDIRDALVLLSVAIIVFVVAHFYNLPPILFHLGLKYPDWALDDTIFIVFVLSVLMIIYGLRRYRDLSDEVKARISAEGEARNLARHDPLTGLPNRRFFEERLDECLAAASATHQMAVLLLDLDGFKAVNDTYGHAAGDDALIQFARRVSKIIRVDAFLARLGGDEFAIIQPKFDTLDDLTNVARRIAAIVAEPFVIEKVTAEFGVGIGISVAPNDGVDPDELVRRAERAL
jgi:diguanylate cyclase (GGDEF)-like protein